MAVLSRQPICRPALPLALVLATSCAGAAGVPLRAAVDVRGLPPGEAARGLPVALEGVVTYAEPRAGFVYVQDDTGGVLVVGPPAAGFFHQLRSGVAIQLQGVTASGGFTPIVSVTNRLPPVLRGLGERPLPIPPLLAAEELQRGAHDGRWIEMRGVIRAANVEPFAGPPAPPNDPEAPPGFRARLELSTAHGRYTVVIPWEPARRLPGGLVDAEVRVRGVLGSIANSRGQWVGLLLYVPALDHVEILRAPTDDPWSLPLRAAGELLKFSPVPRREERVRVRGVVLQRQPGNQVFLRCADGPLEVQGGLPEALAPGVEAEAAGYPALQNKRVVLTDSLVRVVGGGARPAPLDTTAQAAMEKDLHGELVRVRGELVQNTRRGGELLLILNCAGQPVEATLAAARTGAEAARLAAWQPGSVLELTGISQVLGAMDWAGHVRPLSFNLLVGAPSDIRVLRQPPWWTARRLLGVVGVLLAALGLGAAWVVALRRQVARQLLIIREKVQREALWRDRSRIAQDIHDDLGASLTQVSFLSQRVQGARQHPEEAAALADRIAALARSTLRALDEIVWAVNPRHDSLQSLADYLVKLAREQFSLTPVNCLLDVPPVLPNLEVRAEVRHNLALAVKESLHNVVKHARATEAELTLRCEGDRLEIRVRDNGRGFCPGTSPRDRHGLANLAARLAEIGGSCAFESTPGKGALVIFTAPLQAPHPPAQPG